MFGADFGKKCIIMQFLGGKNEGKEEFSTLRCRKR
jgi:hypothetical protein